MSERLPELDELGRRLAAARAGERRAPRRRLLPRAALASTLLLAVAVPALATRSLWAPLAGGETALPDQTPATVRTLLATGTDPEPWRLVAYRARLRNGGTGTCLFLTAGGGGAGQCAPARRALAVVTHATAGATFVAVRAGTPARRVAAHWSDGARQTAPVRVAPLAGGGGLRYAVLRRPAPARGGPPVLAAVRAAASGPSDP